MKKTLHALLVAALSGLLLVACDSQPPPEPRPDEPEPGEPTPAAIAPLPQLDPEQALDPAALAAAEQIADVMLDPDPFSRARRLVTLLPSLGPEGALGAERALRDKKFQSTRGGTEIELLARFWATHEPEAACTWALTRAVAGYRLSAIFAALSQWAAIDPLAARVAVERWEKDRHDVTDIVQIALVHGWFEADPEELGRSILELGMGHERQRKMANYTRLLVERQGPDAAERWATSLPDDDEALKRNAHSQLAAALTAYDLAAALRFCEAHCDGPYGRDLHYVIAVNWARRPDGDRALEWLSTLPEGMERNGAIRNAFSTWAMLHPEAASRWMVARFTGEEGEREPWLQLVVPGFALIVMQERSPAEAIAWAQRIEDEEQRKKLLIRITRAWRWRDEAAAEAWLAESPLSEKERERARQAPRLEDRPRA
ncbi:MAG: hypothetical protein QNK04_25830 [Myxococcota bacterium]|nr:hypothetical protein [Myxococcota bacterium]